MCGEVVHLGRPAVHQADGEHVLPSTRWSDSRTGLWARDREKTLPIGRDRARERGVNQPQVMQRERCPGQFQGHSPVL